MTSKTKKITMEEQKQDSWFTSADSAYLEGLYETFLEAPNQVPDHWQKQFSTLLQSSHKDQSHSSVRERFKLLAQQSRQAQPIESTDISPHQWQVTKLIDGYRNFGHQKANLDPLGLAKRIEMPNLKLSYYNLDQIPSDTIFHTGDFRGLPSHVSLSEIQKTLEKTYANTIGFEYSHITDSTEIEWLQAAIEKPQGRPNFTKEKKLQIQARLTASETLERYLGRRYVGQKRFSLEGAESLIPLLDEIMEESTLNYDVQDIVIGMAHRGRLNVLINTLGKPPLNLFKEFEGKAIIPNSSGDVKYHMGYSSNIKLNNKPIHLTLAFNPSHLEIVSPVVEGSVRARQRRRKDKLREKVIPVLIHGDAAFAGQGVVMETFSMSQARGFRTGGSIHVVINNQVGFTTSNPLDARSSLYCTDIAKMVQAPIFHVNGDDPEAVAFVSKLAFDYRMKFNKDVVIDLVCYRRHGHNESDEPAATQPLMYQAIKKQQTTRAIYANQLKSEGLFDDHEENEMIETYIKCMDEGKPAIELDESATYAYETHWEKFISSEWNEKINSTLPLNTLKKLGKKLMSLPKGFVLQSQVAKVMKDRLSMYEEEKPLDWGAAENLAYATLLEAGFPIRLCGQDCGRGTFAHRHAVVHDQNTGEALTPLQELNKTSAIVIDSFLSEEAVLAFEYGFATTDPTNLVIWEAQFGDFTNGAQVVIDQFISSAEQKWGRYCGLVMLLPHGYEGMGPEHSSARLERFLQLCAQENMQVCVPTNAAQIYHLLRRQMLRQYRKPLVVMSPKSLLRLKAASSPLKDLSEGHFQTIIPDSTLTSTKSVKRIVLCSGKVYYDLFEARKDKEINNILLIRVEQLYPFPKEDLSQQLSQYSQVKDVVWCQEEPQNQGSWYSIRDKITACFNDQQSLSYAGRPAAAAPATGIGPIHKQELQDFLHHALTLKKGKK
jgi:2-oxoglutarate dehydrogenase E1 component